MNVCLNFSFPAFCVLKIEIKKQSFYSVIFNYWPEHSTLQYNLVEHNNNPQTNRNWTGCSIQK